MYRRKTLKTRFKKVLPFIDMSKGGFPVIAETTRNHNFSKEVSQVILAAMVLAPNFLLKKFSASDVSYERKSALRHV